MRALALTYPLTRLGIAFMVAGLVACGGDAAKNDSTAAGDADATATTGGDGLGVSREDMQDVLGSSFTFTKGADAPAGENFTATSSDGGNAVVQLIGPESELRSASMMAMLETEKADAAENAMRHMETFMKKLAPSADPWLKATLDNADFSTEWSDSTVVDDKRVKFMFTPVPPDNRAFVLEVNPK